MDEKFSNMPEQDQNAEAADSRQFLSADDELWIL